MFYYINTMPTDKTTMVPLASTTMLAQGYATFVDDTVYNNKTDNKLLTDTTVEWILWALRA